MCPRPAEGTESQRVPAFEESLLGEDAVSCALGVGTLKQIP